MFQIPEVMLARWQKEDEPKATASDIRLIESSLGIKLPVPYVEFVSQYGFVMFNDVPGMCDQFSYTITYPDRLEAHEGNIAYVMQPDRVIQSYNIATDPDYGEEWSPCFPRNYLPIAGDAGQGLILLELDGDHPGRIWYWTEKQWPWGEEDNTWLGFVAENFYDFINNLHPYRG
jgi:hypothetical protein